MKPLTKLQQLLYILGGVMILIGAAAFVITGFPVGAGFETPHSNASHCLGTPFDASPLVSSPHAWWPVIIYSVGAILFASMQLLARYEGTSVVLRRLRRQQILGALLLVLSGAAMFANIHGITYLRHNEWLAILAIAAVLELYTAFRIPQELKKEQ